MVKLPVVSGRELVKVLLKKGDYIRSQKGSHVHLSHPSKAPLTVPNHKVVAKGTLKAILRQAGLSKEELG